MRDEGVQACAASGRRLAGGIYVALLGIAACGSAGGGADLAIADAEIAGPGWELGHPGEVGSDVDEAGGFEANEVMTEAGGETPIEAVGDVDTWVAACPAGSYYPGVHEADYDGACAGNVGCKKMTCEACTSSCVLCDGPRCMGVVADDSCMSAPAHAGGWAGEPVGGVPSTTSGAVLAMALNAVALQAPGSVPSEARWVDADGVEQSRKLASPVAVIGDRVLVAGAWSLHNYCTGQTIGDTLAPELIETTADGQGRPSASWSGEASDPWAFRVAWIRVYQDADGLRVFQWIEPAASVAATPSGQVLEVATTVTGPLPADVAKPLGVEWGNFDWAAALP